MLSIALVCSRIADAWRPRPRLGCADWCAKYVRLPVEFGIPGRFDLEDFPFWREPLDASVDPEVFGIVLMCATQTGKSEEVKAMMAAWSDLDPSPTMLVGPDKDYVSELRDKIYRTAQLNPVLADRIPSPRRWNLRWIDWGTAYTYLAWTGNTQRVSGKACRRVVCSEVDRFKQPVREGAIAKLIAERVKSFVRYLIVKEGTPTDELSKINAEFLDSDQRHFCVPCPHCGHYQELRFFPHRSGPYVGRGGVGGLKSEDGTWLTPEGVVRGAYYVCEQGCRIESADKPGMVRNGVWCPKGCQVDADGQIVGTPHRSGRVRGYQLGSIYARSITFGRIAAAYLEARAAGDLGLRNFFNNWLGLPYRVRAKVPQWRVLGDRLRGGHPRGTVPAAALFLTCGVDVQQDHCRWSVRGWGEGSSSWLVDWGMYQQRNGGDGLGIANSDLDQVTIEVLSKAWPLVSANATGQKVLHIRLLGADVGFEPHRVWDWVRKHPGDRVRAIAGDPHEASPFFRMNVVERSARDGKAYPGGMQRWGINTNTYKLNLQERWQRELGTPGTWLLTSTPLEGAQTYLQQLTNEGRLAVLNEKTGRVDMRWQVIDPGLGNHFWDIEVYNLALADMVTGGQWDNLTAEAIAAAKTTAGRDRIYPGEGRPDGRPW